MLVLFSDMESAEGILGVMKQAGLEPNDDSYATLMRGYAKKGDLENIRRIVAECEQQEIFLVDRDFLEVIFTLASSKHNDLVKDVNQTTLLHFHLKLILCQSIRI